MTTNFSPIQLQTLIFAAFLLLAVTLSSKRDKDPLKISKTKTMELKGIAILMVIFSHIGYFLFSDHTFLYPLSVGGGVGVNIFLCLSGFGLTKSSLEKQITLIQFYKRRLLNIFIPMWIVLAVVLLLDTILLSKTYSIDTILKSILGFFPRADISLDINSPLWYFSLIFFYYIIYPLVFSKKYPLISFTAILLIGDVLVRQDLPVTDDVLKLYRLHIFAFPLGMLIAITGYKNIFSRAISFFSKKVSTSKIRVFIQAVSTVIMAITACYFLINSGVGESVSKEQTISVLTTLLIICFVLIKGYYSRFLALLGYLSYEIYLIQWPLLSRYDFIYTVLPPSFGTAFYIVIFLVVALAINRFVNLLFKPKKKDSTL